MLMKLIQMDRPPEPAWWLETFVKIARDIEDDDIYQPRGGAYQDYQRPFWRFVEGSYERLMMRA